MIFMEFKLPKVDGNIFDSVWIELDHIVSISECPCQSDRTMIELDSGSIYEVEGYTTDILKEIIDECSNRLD